MATVESSDIKIEDQVNNNNSVDNVSNVKVEHHCDDDGSGESNNNNGVTYNESDDSDKTNLIVNYLPQQMTDDEFENLFKKFGTMKSCKIVRNKVSGYSYGFGFVDFETHEQAIKAIEELNGHELETKKIKVAFARPAGQDIKQANLYIKNVPNNWAQDDVKKVFEPYGNIIQVRVLGNNRGVAFVLFDLRKQAEDALQALNGVPVDGCEVPLEIKFAADKKVEKGGNKSQSNNSPGKSRERGNRGGRGQNSTIRNNRDQPRQSGGRPSNQRSFFDRQNNYDDRQQNTRGGQGQYNAMSYAGGAQYTGNNFDNGVGPIRQISANRLNQRFAPFIPVQQTLAAAPISTAPMAAQLAPNPAYGFQPQQQMIPFAMMPTQQMTAMQPVSQQGQISQNTISMYGTAPLPVSYAPIPQHIMSNMYGVATNNSTTPVATMQPQISQPMTMRNNSSSSSGLDDGVTLFVYNIGPDSDENELRTVFSPYGNVIKCNVVRKTPGGETKGFGFVTLGDRNQANSAISGLDGSLRNGRTLQVSLKK